MRVTDPHPLAYSSWRIDLPVEVVEALTLDLDVVCGPEASASTTAKWHQSWLASESAKRCEVSCVRCGELSTVSLPFLFRLTGLAQGVECASLGKLCSTELVSHGPPAPATSASHPWADAHPDPPPPCIPLSESSTSAPTVSPPPAQIRSSVVPAGKPLDIVLESREEPAHPSVVTSLSGELPAVDTDWLLKRGSPLRAFTHAPFSSLECDELRQVRHSRRWEFWEKKVSQALHASTVLRLMGQGDTGEFTKWKDGVQVIFLRNVISNTAIKAALAVGTFSENALAR